MTDIDVQFIYDTNMQIQCIPKGSNKKLKQESYVPFTNYLDQCTGSPSFELVTKEQ